MNDRSDNLLDNTFSATVPDEQFSQIFDGLLRFLKALFPLLFNLSQPCHSEGTTESRWTS